MEIAAASDTDDLFAFMFSSLLIYIVVSLSREGIYFHQGDYANDTSRGIYFHSRDVSIRRDARSKGGGTRRNLVGGNEFLFRSFTLIYHGIPEAQRCSVKGFCCSVCGRR